MPNGQSDPPAFEMSLLSGGDSDLIGEVVSLADRNSGHLGHFPESCFAEQARQRCILVAKTSTGQLAGYILFARSKGRIRIQQCCVALEFRRSGVGRAMVNALKERSKGMRGIELHCAREFEEEQRFWKRCGFVALGEKPGRGDDRRPLTRFWFDHGHPDLFTAGLDGGDRIIAVVDTNVIIDWQDGELARPQTAKESAALRADWLQPLVEYRIADAVFMDFHRQSDEGVRRRRREFVQGMLKLSPDRDRESAALSTLETLLPKGRPSDETDLRHLAAAIASRANVFITHDEGLLRLSVEGQFEIMICRPAGFVSHVDELVNAESYAPARLAGSSLSLGRPSANEIAQLSSCFVVHARNESERELRRAIRLLMARPREVELQVVFTGGDRPTALVGAQSSGRSLTVGLFRVCSSPVSGVLRRHLVRWCIERAIESGCTEVRVDDSFLEDACRGEFARLGFIGCGSAMARPVIDGPTCRASLEASIVQSIGETSGTDPQGLSEVDAATLEASCWPAAILGEGIRTFVVPIKARWAAALFDPTLAEQILFAVEPKIMLNTENAYYRSSQSVLPTGRSRVLWYVSESDDFDGAGTIRAWSPVVEVAVGPCRELFRAHRHLGVFGWSDVLNVAKGDPAGQILAFRFGPTRVFERAVPRRSMFAWLREAGRKEPPLSGPVEIPEVCFERACEYGLRRADSE